MFRYPPFFIFSERPPYGCGAQPAHPRARPRDEGDENFGCPMDLFDKPIETDNLKCLPLEV